MSIAERACIARVCLDRLSRESGRAFWRKKRTRALLVWPWLVCTDFPVTDPAEAPSPSPPLPGLVQRCVIIQKDQHGFGFTVSGDRIVLVQSVRPGECCVSLANSGQFLESHRGCNGAACAFTRGLSVLWRAWFILELVP